jgi:DNA repair protein RecN (Recombination protein N)
VARLEGLEAEAADIAAEVRSIAEGREADQAVAAELEARLGALYGLLRKYGDSEEAVLAHANQAAADLERLDGIGAERDRRTADDARLRTDAEAAARALGDARRAAAEGAGTAITSVLLELGFPGAAFEVSVADAQLTTHGADEVTFLLAPNLGEPARPLGRIASGGELSRVSLAIEQVLATADTTPTLVFDEVDAGIGGRSADPVGRSLWRLGREHQVLCVTHLPQVAAHADTHLHIAKGIRDGRTVTRIRTLDAEERVEELAAMLAGEASATALEAARELLTRARDAHEAIR